MIKNKYIKLILLVSLILVFSFIFLSRGTKKSPNKAATPTPILEELVLENKPYISLIPRADGHELKLKIENIPSIVEKIEYELLYTAEDEGLEIEKGVGDTVKIDGKNIERDLLLGTASCTNGCKYKYDAGITGGTLSLIFIAKNGQSTTFETQFVLKQTADIKKEGGLKLSIEDFSINATPSSDEFFVLFKNYGSLSNSGTQSVYSVFSSGNGASKISTINPSTVTKTNKNTLTGDYLIQ